MVPQNISAPPAQGVTDAAVASVGEAVVVAGGGVVRGRDVGGVELDFGVGEEDGAHGTAAQEPGAVAAFQGEDNFVAEVAVGSLVLWLWLCLLLLSLNLVNLVLLELDLSSNF
jgi:hypothetical protein